MKSLDPDHPNYLRGIFETQLSLAVKYKEIEGMPDWPFDLNSVENQVWIKDFLWRTAEELAEAMDVLEARDLFLEELSDALHFLVEAMIISGSENRVKYLNLDSMVRTIKDKQVPGDKGQQGLIKEVALELFVALGLVGNTLKNKKWKKTKVDTNYPLFESRMHLTFNKLIELFVICGCDAQDIYDIYHNKANINKNRQKNNY